MKALSRRFLAGTMTAAVLAALVVSFLLYRSSREVFALVKRQVSLQQTETSRQTAQSIEGKIRLLVRELELLARNPAVQRIDPSGAREALEHSFRYVTQFSVNDVSRTDAAGIVRLPLTSPELVGRDFSWRPYFREAARRTGPEPVFEFLTFQGFNRGRRGLLLGMPVFTAAGAFDGTVVFVIEVDDLIRASLPRPDATTLAWVIDQDGTVLSHPHAAVGDRMEDLAGSNEGLLGFVRAIKTGAAATATYTELGGKTVFATAQPLRIGDQTWSVVMETEESLVGRLLFSPHLQNLLGLIIAIAAILSCVAAAVVMVRRWTSALAREIRERKDVESRLRLEEENYRSLIDNSPS